MQLLALELCRPRVAAQRALEQHRLGIITLTLEGGYQTVLEATGSKAMAEEWATARIEADQQAKGDEE